MKLEEVRQTYYEYSGKTSEILRQLGFAGIALVWIFKTGVEANPTIPNNLVIPAFLIVVGLTLDLSQYVTASAIWGIYNRWKEKKGTSDEEDFEAPRFINWATLFFFWTKILCMITAYIFIIIFLRSRFT